MTWLVLSARPYRGDVLRGGRVGVGLVGLGVGIVLATP